MEASSSRKHALTPQEKAAAQRRDGLQLSRKRILEQLQSVQNPRHKQMLEAALAELDSQLAALH